MYEKLLKDYGSPLYVYEEDVLEARCQDMKHFADRLKAGLPNGINVQMHYSTKANSSPYILNIVKKSGLSVDCMSPFELAINQKVGFKNENMLYVCNNIDSEEMKLVHDTGILICLDSISQVETWGRMYPGTDIMVRINPGGEGVGHSKAVITAGKETKFGISEANLQELFEVTTRYGLNIIGTHQHLGSLFLDDKVDNYIAGVEAGLAIVKKYFSNIQIVDLGGGFGVPYKPNEKPLNLDRVADRLLPILVDFVSVVPVTELKFEPGRFIPCEAGSLLGRVTAVKKENGITWVGTDIGMNQLVRPSMYGSYHDITIHAFDIHELFTRHMIPEKVNICGNVCESGDVLAKKREIYVQSERGVKIGDFVIVANAGAYGYSMASNYTGRCRPAEVVIKSKDVITKNTEVMLIRERETIEQLYQNCLWDFDE